MNRFFISLLGSMFLFASVFAEETPLRSTKAVKMQKLERSRLVENQPTLEARSSSYWNKPYRHENRNGALSVLVDSSGNGFTNNAIAALNYAVANGAPISNLSLIHI